MPVNYSYDDRPRLSDQFHGYHRLTVETVDGREINIYNGYKNFPFRLVSKIVDLRTEFGAAQDGANSELQIVCLHGLDMGRIRVAETAEDLTKIFSAKELPVPVVEIALEEILPQAEPLRLVVG